MVQAEGPFPQGTGSLTCMSRELALELAGSEEFARFLELARVRIMQARAFPWRRLQLATEGANAMRASFPAAGAQ